MMAIGVLAGAGGPSTGLSNGTPHSNNTPNTVSDIQHPKKNQKPSKLHFWDYFDHQMHQILTNITVMNLSV